MMIKNCSENIWKQIILFILTIVHDTFVEFLVQFVEKASRLKLLQLRYCIVFVVIRLKKALNNDSISLWQSLIPVSIKLVRWKFLGLFVSITYIEEPTGDFTHAIPGVRFEISNFLNILLFKISILRSPTTRAFSYFLLMLLRDLLSHLEKPSLLLLHGGL